MKREKAFRPDRIGAYFRVEWLPLALVTLSGLIYNMLDLPEDLYTPLFATARIAGWCAHRMEEVVTGNRIMRPAYRAAVEHRAYVPMEKRQ